MPNQELTSNSIPACKRLTTEMHTSCGVSPLHFIKGTVLSFQMYVKKKLLYLTKLLSLRTAYHIQKMLPFKTQLLT